jgi:pimeloyl-ACP methyl ester carboxylesterase
MVIVVGCTATSEVHTKRADPIGSAPLTSDQTTDSGGPNDTGPNDTGPNDTTSPTDTTVETQSSLQWGPCHDPSAEDPKLQCTTLRVPLDYDNPSGDTIEMAMVRVPASGDRQGAVLFNPGGPGASGFDFIASSGPSIAAGFGLDNYDLIGFDPRGVDRSGGIHCVTDEFEDKHLYIDQSPDTPEEQALKDEAETGFVDGCVQKYGDTLRFYSTANTAHDMDAIRSALGDDQISFLGGSYGTYLGATYATLYPDRVRAMVLDSAYEPNDDTAEQQFETTLVGFEGAFKNWVTWCQNEPTCDFAAPDVGARWDALDQQLDDAPIAGTDGRVANNAVIERATTAALYSPSDWPVLAQALANAATGDPTGIFALADSYNGRNGDGTFETLFQSLRVIRCASGIGAVLPDDPEALAATLRAAAPRFGKDITAQDLITLVDECTQLVDKVAAVELTYTGDGPVVVVGGTNDPATPIRWAQKMTGELGPHARLVTYTGEGHGQLLVNSCVTDIEASVLTDLKLPEPDKVCDADPIVEKPDWWGSLPVPDGISDVASLPAVDALLAEPTKLFSEIRTTSLSAQDTIAEYNDLLHNDGFQPFDEPQILTMTDVSQGAYVDFTGRAVIVVALGPKAFDDKALQSARSEVPPNTTVVWVIAIPA